MIFNSNENCNSVSKKIGNQEVSIKRSIFVKLVWNEVKYPSFFLNKENIENTEENRLEKHEGFNFHASEDNM